MVAKQKKEGHSHWLKTLTAIISILASILTTYVAMTRTPTEAKFVSPPTNPYLKSFMVADSTQKHSGIKVQNSGRGHLTINKIKIYKRGEFRPVDNNSYAIQKAFDIEPYTFSFDLLHARDALEQGDERWIIQSLSNSPKTSRITQKIANNISIVVCYCAANDTCEIKTIGVQTKHSMQC